MALEGRRGGWDSTLLTRRGIGPVSAAQALLSWSHPACRSGAGGSSGKSASPAGSAWAGHSSSSGMTSRPPSSAVSASHR